MGLLLRSARSGRILYTCVIFVLNETKLKIYVCTDCTCAQGHMPLMPNIFVKQSLRWVLSTGGVPGEAPKSTSQRDYGGHLHQPGCS